MVGGMQATRGPTPQRPDPCMKYVVLLSAKLVRASNGWYNHDHTRRHLSWEDWWLIEYTRTEALPGLLAGKGYLEKASERESRSFSRAASILRMIRDLSQPSNRLRTRLFLLREKSREQGARASPDAGSVKRSAFVSKASCPVVDRSRSDASVLPRLLFC